MKKSIAAMLVGVFLASPALAGDSVKVGEISTTYNLLTANDKVIVDRFDDPKVKNASCYVSHAVTGGLKGMIGLATDPSRMSIACRATGPVSIIGPISKGQDGELVFAERTSALFKSLQVTRFYDQEKNVLVYLVTSVKLLDGSPFNNVTAIALN